jgi:hypothetical protein
MPPLAEFDSLEECIEWRTNYLIRTAPRLPFVKRCWRTLGSFLRAYRARRSIRKAAEIAGVMFHIYR